MNQTQSKCSIFTNKFRKSKLLAIINFINSCSTSISYAESNWGLPLAIAASLHVPFRIEIGIANIDKAIIEDARGKGRNEYYPRDSSFSTTKSKI